MDRFDFVGRLVPSSWQNRTASCCALVGVIVIVSVRHSRSRTTDWHMTIEITHLAWMRNDSGACCIGSIYRPGRATQAPSSPWFAFMTTSPPTRLSLPCAPLAQVALCLYSYHFFLSSSTQHINLVASSSYQRTPQVPPRTFLGQAHGLSAHPVTSGAGVLAGVHLRASAILHRASRILFCALIKDILYHVSPFLYHFWNTYSGTFLVHFVVLSIFCTIFVCLDPFCPIFVPFRSHL